MQPHLKGFAEKISECKMNYRAGEQGLFLCNQFTEAASTMPQDITEGAKGRMGLGNGAQKKQIANK